ncbi:hypothetical protein ACIQC5_22005 [Paenarthrobacter sp. NPDC092416]|uniref:hypothetical protein n=1 Tax=Paenarthrobacter sp. NPDC092416 TaxID=3364386 RepID=UPI0037FD266A
MTMRAWRVIDRYCSLILRFNPPSGRTRQFDGGPRSNYYFDEAVTGLKKSGPGSL